MYYETYYKLKFYSSLKWQVAQNVQLHQNGSESADAVPPILQLVFKLLISWCMVQCKWYRMYEEGRKMAMNNEQNTT